MSALFENKVAAVTGGAGGFGFGIAKRLLEYGVQAVWLLSRGAGSLEKAGRELSALYPGRVFTLQTDVSAVGAIEAALDEVVKTSGRLDVLFNNAGRPMTRPATQITPEEFRDLIALNYTGVVMGTLKALHIMEAQGSGLIVNAASCGGLFPMPYQCSYASTKAAVITFTRCLAYEYAGRDIRFAQYSPTNVATNIFTAERAEKMRREGKSEAEIAEAIKDVRPPEDAIPLDRALDMLFAGLEAGKVDIIIGDETVEQMIDASVNNRKAYDDAILAIGAGRRAYYEKVAEAIARGESADSIPFPG